MRRLPVILSLATVLVAATAEGAGALTAPHRLQATVPQAGTPLPGLKNASDIVVDDVHHQVFVSQGTDQAPLFVLGFDGHMITTLADEDGADQMALDPSTGILYVARSGHARIDEIDTAATPPVRTGAINTSAAAPSTTGGLTLLNGKLWVGLVGDNCYANSVIASVNPAPNPPGITTYTPDQRACFHFATVPAAPTMLLAWDGYIQEYFRFDLSTLPPTMAPQSGGFGMGFPPTLSPDGRVFYNDGTGGIIAVRTSNFRQTAPSCPNGAIFGASADGRTLTWGAGLSVHVDSVTPSLCRPGPASAIPAPGTHTTLAGAVSGDGSTVFAITGEPSAIDPGELFWALPRPAARGTGQASPTPLPQLSTFASMAVDDAHGRVFVTGGAFDSSIDVMNLDGSFRTRIAEGYGPADLVLDPAADRLYVALNGQGEVHVYDTSTDPPALRGAIRTGAAAPMGGGLALAHGTLWFGYRGWPRACGLASVSLAGGPARIYHGTGRDDCGTRLAASPGDPNLLLEWDGSYAGPTFTRFDLSTGRPVLAASVRALDLNSVDAVAVSPDGSMFWVRGQGFRMSDLRSRVSCPGPSSGYAGAGALTADGSRLVMDWWVFQIEIWVYRVRGTTCTMVSNYDLGTEDDVPDGGLGLAGDGSMLFAVAQPFGEPPSLYTASDPLLPASSLSLTDPSGPVQVGSTLAVTGTLAFTDGSAAGGKTIHLSVTPPGGSPMPGGSAVTTSSGAFSVPVKPTATGTYSFQATFDGDAGHRAGVSNSVSVEATSPLTLGVTPTTADYRTLVTATAHLAAFHTNDVVSIYKTTTGGTFLVKQGTIDAGGNLSATLQVYGKTTFYATWAGDDRYAPAQSAPMVVNVRSSTSGAMTGYYGTSGSYRLYHYTSSCVNPPYTGCPTFVVTVTPNHAGKTVVVDLQAYVNGSWQDAGSDSPPLGSDSKVTEIVSYSDTSVINVQFRIMATFGGDDDHLGSASAWSYFKVTS